MKKALSILLSLILVIAALPLAAVESSAVTAVISQDGLWKYYVDSLGNAIIDSVSAENKAYLGNDTNVTVPSIIDGYPVVCIGAYAFYNCSAVENITVPEGVTNFGDHAFDGCSSLTSINVPTTLSSSNIYAFLGCDSLNAVHITDLEAFCRITYTTNGAGWSNPLATASAALYLNGVLVTDLVIPETITAINAGAFNGCSSIESVTLHSGVTSIGHRAFKYNENLNEINFGGVTSIGDAAFTYCTSLTSVSIPTGVSSLPYQAFSDCTSLTTAFIPSNVSSIGNEAFNGCPSLTIIAPSGSAAQTYANNNGFNYQNSSFTSQDGNWLCQIIDVNSVSIVSGGSTKAYLGNETNLVIPSTIDGYTVKSLGYRAFYQYTALQSVTIPNTVTRMENSTFNGCTGLTSVTVPDSVVWIGSWSFANCSNLLSCTLSNSLEIIRNDLFDGSAKLSSIVIPDSVISIETKAFYNCTGLISATLGNSVETIGEYAFYCCSNMEAVYIPASLKTSGRYAFYGCNKLKTYIKDIGAWCGINFNNGEGVYASPLDDGRPLYIYDSVANDYVLAENIVIPNTVTEIKPSVFLGCSSVKHIVFPEGITKIDNLTFYHCSNLESITIPSTLTEISSPSNAYDGCNKLKAVHISDLTAWCNITFPSETANPLYYAKKLYLNGSLLTDLVIPSTVTDIKAFSFYNCTSITSVTVHDGVVSTRDKAFYNCTSLNAVYITDLEAWCNMAHYSNMEGSPLFYAHNLYVNGVYGPITVPSSITTLNYGVFAGISNDVTVPGTVTTIGKCAFYNSTSTSITLQEGIQTIGDWVFGNSTGITNITIPDSVTSIGISAFRECSIQNITGGSGLKTIGTYAFYNSTSLISATFNSVESIGERAFYGCSNMERIYLPASLKTSDKYAFYGCNKLKTYIKDIGAWCGINFNNGEGVYASPLDDGRPLYIYDSALDDYALAENIVIPNTVTEIKPSVFLGCSSVKNIVIPEGITKIDNLTFYHCSNLESITIPGTLTEISAPSNAFDGCNKFKAVYISDLEAWCNITFQSEIANPLYCAKNLYLNGNLITDLVIPGTVTTVNQYAFYNGTCFKTLEFSEGVTTINCKAFSGCSNLESVTVSDTVSTFNGGNVFDNCNKLNAVYITDLEAWCNMAYFTNLYSNPLLYAHNLYVNGEYGTVTIPSTVSTLNFGTFAGISNDVVVPGNVTTIGKSAFWKCKSSSITIKNGVQTIGEYAFIESTNLTEMIIPRSVTSISSNSFQSCSNIQNYYCYVRSYADSFLTTASIKHYIGDMNSDGDVDLTDYAEIKTYLAGENIEPLTGIQETVGDYNLDGAIDAFDMFEIDRDRYFLSFPTDIRSDDFESYNENATITSGVTPYTLKYNGTGDGNQKIIVAQQANGENGKVLQLQGRGSWSSAIRYSFTPNEQRFIVFKADINPVSGTFPDGVTFGSSKVSGSWEQAVCRFGLQNNGFFCGTADTSTNITTDLTYSNGNWYRIKMVLDRKTNLYYLFFDGTLINANGYSAAAATPEWIKLGSGNAGTNTTYYDNVNLYSTNDTACINP